MRVAALYGDRLVAEGDDEASRWCREQLGNALLEEVRRSPVTLELESELGRGMFAHATPRSDEEIVARITPSPELAVAFDAVTGADVVGHTHVQFDLGVGLLRVENAGSVGMSDELSPHTAEEATTHFEGFSGT